MLETIDPIENKFKSEIGFRNDYHQSIKLLRESSSLVANSLIPRSWVHGDFNPSNILVCEERIVGIDVDIRYDNVVVLDMAHFLNHTCAASWHPRGLTLSTRITDLCEAFVEGYGDNRLELNYLPLLWTRLHNALRLWARSAAPSGTSLKNRYLSYRFDRMAQQLAKDIGRIIS